MNRRSFAALIAASFVLSTVSARGYADNDISDETDKAVFTVDTSSGKAVSKYIYGINDVKDMSGIRPTAIKQRGVALSSYNWETNAANSGVEGGSTNDVSLVGGYPSTYWRTPALYTEQLISKASRYDVPMRLVTLQMMGSVAGDSLGVVSEEDEEGSRWKTVKFNKNDAYSTRPDIPDEYVYMDEYVSYMVNMYGTAGKGGISGYFLDNCPDKWAENFPYVMSARVTPSEYAERSAQLAQAVRTIDGDALIFAPSLSNLDGCINFGDEQEWVSGGYSADNMWFVDYYLDEMKKSSDAAGQRLLDCFDIHYYTEARSPLGEDVLTSNDDSADKYRMQAVRTLWDQDYTENSVTGLVNKRFTPILPTLQASLRVNYPGTMLSVSEYDFGGGGRMSGAVAEIDALGTFANEGVYVACLSPSEGDIRFQKAALRLFTDFDGKGSSFGSEMLTTTGDDRTSSVYAGTDNGDISSVKLIVTNQNLLVDKHIEIELNGSYDYRVEKAYLIDKETADIVETDTEAFSQTDSGISFTAGPLSAYMIILSGEMPEESLPDETVVSHDDIYEVTDVTRPSETIRDETESTESVTALPDETGTETNISVTETSHDSQTAADTEAETELSEVTDTVPDEKDDKQPVPLPLKIAGSLLTAGAMAGVLFILIFDRK